MSILTITNENFQKEVIESSAPVLLDFWASWCGPCRMMSTVIDDLANDAQDFIIGKVNVDEQNELASSFKIMSIPTLVVIKDGAVVKQSAGVKSRQQVLDMLA